MKKNNISPGKRQSVYGVTLMELVAAIIILSILAVLGNTMMYKARMKASVKMAANNLKIIWGAERVYRQIRGKYFPLSGDVTDLAQINGNLSTDIVGTNEWTYCITGKQKGNRYTATAELDISRWPKTIKLEISNSDGNVSCKPPGGPGCRDAGY